MRIDQQQSQTILETSRRFLGERVTVLLFGSRADDMAKGGDVDLYIETAEPPGIWRQVQLLAELEKRLGFPVDLVLHSQDEPEKPIHRIAKLMGGVFVMNSVFAERKAHLSRKLGVIHRLVCHLEYSRNRLAYPISSVDVLGEAEMESVSVLVEHFGKLQDLLGNVFREMLVLSGEDACCLGDFSSLFPHFSHRPEWLSSAFIHLEQHLYHFPHRLLMPPAQEVEISA